MRAQKRPFTRPFRPFPALFPPFSAPFAGSPPYFPYGFLAVPLRGRLDYTVSGKNLITFLTLFDTFVRILRKLIKDT